MKFLFDFFPILLFFIVLKTHDIYWATGVAMVAVFIQVGWFYFRHRRVEPMHIITLVVITVFGGLTIYLQDERFIKLKPTVIYWIFAIILSWTQWLGKQPGLKSLLGKQIEMSDVGWYKMNLGWIGFFVIMGVVNLYVAFYYGQQLEPKVQTEHWAAFKAFVMPVLTLIFAFGQMMVLHQHMDLEKIANKTNQNENN